MDGQVDGPHRNESDGVIMADGLLHIEAGEALTGMEGTWIRVRDHGWTIAITNYLARSLTYDTQQCVDWVHRWVVECHLPVLPADVTTPGYARPVPTAKPGEEGAAAPAAIVPADYVRQQLTPITDPKALTVDILENEMDSKMVGWLTSAIHQGAQTALTLSPFALRISSNGTDKPPAAPNDTPAKGPSRRRKK